MFYEETESDEKCPHDDRHRQIGTERDPQSPEDDLHLDAEEERRKDQDESLVSILEFLVIVVEGIDAGKDCEQGATTVHKQRYNHEPPEFRQGAVQLTSGIPV